MQYKGIELEETDKKVAMSHSRFLEKDEGAAWIDRLLATDKGVLDRAQFHEASALSSVLNLNYQVCNGGVSQYFLNGYDEYRKPCHEQDVEQLDIHEQVKMLERLHVFGCEVFPNRTDENQTVAKVGAGTRSTRRSTAPRGRVTARGASRRRGAPSLMVLLCILSSCYQYGLL